MKFSQGLVLMAAVCVMPLSAAVTIVPSGDVTFRMLDNYTKVTSMDGDRDSSVISDFVTQYAWNFKASIAASENLAFGFRLSNPSGSLFNTISSNDKLVLQDTLTGKKVLSSDGVGRIVAIPEASMTLKTKKVDFSAGIIEVKANTVLDVAAVESGSYKNVGSTTSNWQNNFNNSQAGLSADLKAVSSDAFGLNLKVFAAVANDYGADTVGEKNPGYNAVKHDQIRFGAQVPVVLNKKLTIAPAVHVKTNAYRKNADTGCASLTGGLDIGYKGAKGLAVKFGAAMGGFDKRNDAENLIGTGTAPLGILAQAGVSYAIKVFTPSVDVVYGNWRERSTASTSVNSQLHFDVKLPVAIKGLTIMPRIRTWSTQNPAENNDWKEFKIRPELLFKASFK